MLMNTHRVQPLAVYKDDQYVHPTTLNATLKYALVELHFTLKHFCIRKKETKPLDSFTGRIEQIIILKPGEPRSTGTYKRKNLLEGPVRPKPFKLISASQYVPPGTTALRVQAPVTPAHTGNPSSGPSAQHTSSVTPMVTPSEPFSTDASVAAATPVVPPPVVANAPNLDSSTSLGDGPARKSTSRVKQKS